MTHLLPIVEQLADCRTDAERADWLLRVPLGVIYRDSAEIRALLREAHFYLGVECLDAEFAAVNSTRRPDGSLTRATDAFLQASRSFLAEVAGGKVRHVD